MPINLQSVQIDKQMTIPIRAKPIRDDDFQKMGSKPIRDDDFHKMGATSKPIRDDDFQKMG